MIEIEESSFKSRKRD